METQYISVVVHPGSKKDVLVQTAPGRLEAWIRAKPTDTNSTFRRRSGDQERVNRPTSETRLTATTLASAESHDASMRYPTTLNSLRRPIPPFTRRS